MPISQDQITTLDQLEEKLTLALTDLLLLRDSNNEDYKVKASTILQAAVDKAGAELIGGNVESGNTKAVTGNTVNTTLDSYAKSYNYNATKLDFNDFTKTGFYRIGDISIYSNAPSGAVSYGQLIVSHNGDTTAQIYFNFNDNSRMFSRCFNNTFVGASWRTIITETLLTSALTKVPIIIKATLSEDVTIPANNYLDVTYTFDNVGFTPRKVLAQFAFRISDVCILSTATAAATSTSVGVRIYNHKSTDYTLAVASSTINLLLAPA